MLRQGLRDRALRTIYLSLKLPGGLSKGGNVHLSLYGEWESLANWAGRASQAEGTAGARASRVCPEARVCAHQTAQGGGVGHEQAGKA